MATDDLKDELRALHVWPQSAADTHADVMGPRHIKGLYAVGNVAERALARIEALEAQLAGTNALIRDLAALPPGGEVWDRSKQLADFTLRARAIEAGPANP